ncbi:MAG: hypothetical protein ACI8RD_008057 [Bacillariaceae sp.]
MKRVEKWIRFLQQPQKSHEEMSENHIFSEPPSLTQQNKKRIENFTTSSLKFKVKSSLDVNNEVEHIIQLDIEAAINL